MTDVVVVDTNLPMLPAVGSASKVYIEKHKLLREFSIDDFELLVELIGRFSDMVILPYSCGSV